MRQLNLKHVNEIYLIDHVFEVLILILHGFIDTLGCLEIFSSTSISLKLISINIQNNIEEVSTIHELNLGDRISTYYATQKPNIYINFRLTFLNDKLCSKVFIVHGFSQKK